MHAHIAASQIARRGPLQAGSDRNDVHAPESPALSRGQKVEDSYRRCDCPRAQGVATQVSIWREDRRVASERE